MVLDNQFFLVLFQSGAAQPMYLMDHSGGGLLIDPSVRLYAMFPAPQRPDTMLETFLKIRLQTAGGSA